MLKGFVYRYFDGVNLLTQVWRKKLVASDDKKLGDSNDVMAVDSDRSEVLLLQKLVCIMAVP